MTYKLGSLFDGSGGFPLAGSLCGITPAWASEVEPYPIAVTRSRFPDMKHLGDISKIHGGEIEPVDIITFGSPCQDLSVAGKRAGLKHEANGDEETTRSGLFMEAVRIIKEMREATNGRYPAFALWENVPGAFSSNKGEDFRIVLQELIQIVEPGAFMPPVPKNGWPYADHYWGDGWSIAYRVFDAQYWGVPQRRRRIHLVLDLRGERAREILFERDGVRGHFEAGRTPWQAVAGDAANGSGVCCAAGWPSVHSERDLRWSAETRGGAWDDATPGACRILCYGEGDREDAASDGTLDGRGSQILGGVERGVEQCLAFHLLQDPVSIEEKTPCLTAGNSDHGQASIGVCLSAGFKAGNGAKANGIGWQEEMAPTLSAAPSGTNQAPAVCIKEALPFDTTQVTSPQNGNHPKWGDPCHPLAAQGHPLTVVFAIDQQGGKGSANYSKNVVPTILSDSHGTPHAVAYAMPGFGDYKESDVASGLKARDYKDATDLVCGIDCRNLNESPELYPTLQSKSEGGWSLNFSHAVRIRYIVRRLTPTECARLQGFADKWGHPEQKEDFSEEEYRFWLEVRNTHAAINGKPTKEHTEAQMLTWYNKLHTDSAEYKMWGNGIALPPALYCMQGIRDALDEREVDQNNQEYNKEV